MDGACFDKETSFNADQKKTACSLVRSLSALREDTLDSDISDRQSHILILLGLRKLVEESGGELNPMKMTRLRKIVQDQFEVTDTAAENDISFLKKENLIEARPSEKDRRVREAILSESGEAVFDELSERLASLILTLARRIEEQGTVPINPIDRIKGFLFDFATRVQRVPAVQAIVFATATTVGSVAGVDIAWADVKGFYDEGLTVRR